jgi:hypothetical protein
MQHSIQVPGLHGQGVTTAFHLFRRRRKVKNRNPLYQAQAFVTTQYHLAVPKDRHQSIIVAAGRGDPQQVRRIGRHPEPVGLQVLEVGEGGRDQSTCSAVEVE